MIQSVFHLRIAVTHPAHSFTPHSSEQFEAIELECI